MHNFIPYGRQSIDDNDVAAVLRTLRSDYLTQGPEVDRFEAALCEYTEAKYCVAVSNATAGLHLAVAALQLAEGSVGITSPITFVASANCMVYNRLVPRFADIQEDTHNIEPGEIDKMIDDNTKLVIPVHFAGQPAGMETISELCNSKGVSVIEDAAHAIGSRYPGGDKVGSCVYSKMTVFSFHPVKTITTGEGGAITTNDPALYERLKLLRTHGINKNFLQTEMNPGPWYQEMRMLGYNFRLTDLQAALGTSQLGRLDNFVARRKEIVARYNDAFSKIPWVKTPTERNPMYSAFHLYVLEVDFVRIGKSRSTVMEELHDRGIGTQVHYIPVYTQPYYRQSYGYDWGLCPNAEKYYQRALSIPLFPTMHDNDVARVISAVSSLGQST